MDYSTSYKPTLGQLERVCSPLTEQILRNKLQNPTSPLTEGGV
jgi:hypothetical protein